MLYFEEFWNIVHIVLSHMLLACDPITICSLRWRFCHSVLTDNK